MNEPSTPQQVRRADHDIEQIFLRRWSPRAMSGAPVAQAELERLFEAARWAPSTYNEQEWRFRYAHRDSPHWPAFFGLLGETNRQWCVQAGVLVAIFAHTKLQKTGKPNPVHLFDCGAAFENLALQATVMDLVVHGMAGFDWDRAGKVLEAPADHVVAAMFAVGRPGDPAQLPPALRDKEVPSDRRPITGSIGEGPFGAG